MMAYEEECLDRERFPEEPCYHINFYHVEPIEFEGAKHFAVIGHDGDGRRSVSAYRFKVRGDAEQERDRWMSRELAAWKGLKARQRAGEHMTIKVHPHHLGGRG
jgi:hypothetical protein